MGIYIKGMEMPTRCHCCSMCVQVSDGEIDWHWECCLLCEKVARYAADRIPSCPLVPVPKHGRLIDADEAIGHLFIGEQCLYSWDEIEEAIDATETIIPAEEGE